MASEKYILVRPPQLPELQTIGQGVYLVGYDQQTDRTVKVNVQSIGGGEQAPALNWRADTEYSEDNIVEFGLRLWKSLVNNNVGNIPLEGNNWTEVSRASAATTSIPSWAAGVYTHSPTLVLRNNAIYRLTRPVPFESTDFEAEASATIPVWTKIQADGGGHIFEDQSGTALPTRNVAKAGAGIEFEDDAVGEMTVVKLKEYIQPISFAITDTFTFKPALALSIISADVSANISDLRVGKNGATPTTITYPYPVIASDVLTFEVSFTDAYNRELNSFITLKGQYV